MTNCYIHRVFLADIHQAFHFLVKLVLVHPLFIYPFLYNYQFNSQLYLPIDCSQHQLHYHQFHSILNLENIDFTVRHQRTLITFTISFDSYCNVSPTSYQYLQAAVYISYAGFPIRQYCSLTLCFATSLKLSSSLSLSALLSFNRRFCY